jgi:hypothetical protein
LTTKQNDDKSSFETRNKRKRRSDKGRHSAFPALRGKTMSTIEIKYQGKWKSFTLQDGKSDVLRRTVDLDTGEMWSYLGKQLQGKKLKPGSDTYTQVLAIARRCAI